MHLRLFSFVTVINNVLMNNFGYKVTVRAPGYFKQVVRCEVTVHRHSISEVCINYGITVRFRETLSLHDVGKVCVCIVGEEGDLQCSLPPWLLLCILWSVLWHHPSLFCERLGSFCFFPQPCICVYILLIIRMGRSSSTTSYI